MSLSSSLSAALSGLNASSRRAQLVSSNIANAMTEGYGVRRLSVASETVAGAGTGVRIEGVVRTVDQGVLSDRRLADGRAGAHTSLANLHRTLEATIGSPEETGSLSQRIAAFEAALVEATARPESAARLASIRDTAVDLTTKISEIGETLVAERQAADTTIAETVTHLNATLANIAEINGQIARSNGGGRDVSSLMDQRQVLIDQVAAEIPLREIPRDNGEVALYSTGGVVLLDITPAEFGFDARNVITPEMSIGSGALSPLLLNGQPLAVDGPGANIAGGRLSALFTLRDDTIPAAQARIDAVARDLVERFQDPAVDPTLGLGHAGLLTDGGGAFDPVNEVGLSLRLTLNAQVDPAAGGDLRYLRDGLGATVPGPTGDSSHLQRLVEAMSGARTAGSGDFVAAPRSAAGFAAEFLSTTSAARASAETREAYSSAQQQSLKERELAGGVDTDLEMQQLLLIEQAYSANARVIEIVGELLERLQRI